MSSMNPQNLELTERESQRAEQQAQASREELVDRLGRAIREDGTCEPLKGLHLYRSSFADDWVHGVSDPAFCVVAQGTKEVVMGEDTYRYDPYHYLLATVELPVASKVFGVSKETPYLGFRLNLDSALVGSVMVEAGTPSLQSAANVRAIDVSVLDATLLDAVVRLVRLIEAPAEARMLMLMVMREIVFWLLLGEQSARLRHIAVLGGHSERIARAIDRLRTDFNQPLRIENIAREVGMSVSGFHHHFKAVTAMSPLQFQKQLRLQAARRLMLGDDLDAASAGYQVGYDDAAHFSREYKRLFGQPPMRDVKRLRADTRTGFGQ